MLRIKYFDSFKNNSPFIVVVADKEGLNAAYDFFRHNDRVFLNEESITEFSDIAPLERAMLYLNSTECKEIAQHFRNIYAIDKPGHAYFDTEALGEKIEIIISYLEYDEFFSRPSNDREKTHIPLEEFNFDLELFL
jgi:hypothetical protein